VFVPTAFMTGLTGQFYKQFAMTIAISTVISAFNSLTLSPALAACCSRPRREAGRLTRQMNRFRLRPLLRRLQPLLRPLSFGYATARGVTGVICARLGHGRLCRLLGLTVGLSYLVPRRLRAGSRTSNT
jgi:multidrug efflux pump subunit AcrB